MNVATGEIIASRIRRNDSVTFMSFLLMPGQPAAPGLRIHLITGNGSSHTSKATRAWITAHPRFSVTYTPEHASWLTMTGQWSGVLTRKLLRRGDFTSREHLEAQITGFTIRHNQTAHPYKRSYDADAGHARYPDATPGSRTSPRPHDRDTA